MRAEPLYVIVNDLIGGVALSHVDKPRSEIDSRPVSPESDAVVADMIALCYAELFVQMWNAALEGKRIWWCEKDKRQAYTYGFNDAHNPCEYAYGRRDGHEECGYRLQVILPGGPNEL